MNPWKNKRYLLFISKCIITLFLVMLWLIDSNLFSESSDLFFAGGVSLFFLSTLVYGIIFNSYIISGGFYNYFLFTDIAILLIFILPSYPIHILFLSSVLILNAMIFLISKNNTRKALLITYSFLAMVVLVAKILLGDIGYLKSEFSYFFMFSVVSLAIMNYVSGMFNRYSEQLAKLKEANNNLRQKHHKLNNEINLSSQRLEFLNKNLRKKSFEIQNILALTDQFGENPDSKNIISSFLLTMAGQIGCSHTLFVGKSEPYNNYYSVLEKKGIHDQKIEKFRIYMDSFLVQILSGTRNPIPVKKIPSSQLYRDEKEILNYFENDYISPIIIRNKMIGMFIIGEKLSGSEFSNEDLNLISILTNQAAFILEQSKLNDEIFDFYNKSVRTLLRAQELKDSFSKGHIIRTTQYVQALSKRMNVAGEDQKKLIYGTILHDVGKIVINENLLKYDKIISEEEAGIKKKILDHTLIGASILKSVGFDAGMVDLALHHHEWYNGNGYPHQLKGNKISLPARMLSVCNAYDAMTSDKPYRKSMQFEWAIDQLQKGAAKQFDPDIVKIFVDEMQSNKKLQRLSIQS